MHKTMLICSFFTNDDQTIRCDQMLLDLYIRSRTRRSRVCIWYFMNMVLIKIIAIFHKWCYWQTKGLWQTGTRPVNPTTQPAMFWNFKKVKIIDLVYNLISQAHGCVHESNKTMFWESKGKSYRVLELEIVFAIFQNIFLYRFCRSLPIICNISHSKTSWKNTVLYF